jgi:hypothetical protein
MEVKLGDWGLAGMWSPSSRLHEPYGSVHYGKSLFPVRICKICETSCDVSYVHLQTLAFVPLSAFSQIQPSASKQVAGLLLL